VRPPEIGLSLRIHSPSVPLSCSSTDTPSSTCCGDRGSDLKHGLRRVSPGCGVTRKKTLDVEEVAMQLSFIEVFSVSLS